MQEPSSTDAFVSTMTAIAWVAQKKRAMLLKITNWVSASEQVVYSNMVNEREKKIETH
jgi:hypothetical protein